MINNYIVYHLHSELSLLDSCTNFKLYVDRAVELGQKSICFSEHGNIYNWVHKKMYCDEKGIKYIHGVEMYLTETLAEKVRDNMHTIIIARNFEGVKELNKLIDISTQEDHFYYKNRISFDEFLNTSDNLIRISACLASPLARLSEDNPYYEKLLKKYDYYEIQPHINSEDQKGYNKKLYQLSLKYSKPLIVGTDTHSLNKFKSECRSILQKAKRIEYSDEDKFDLTYKSYDELVEMFRQQNCLPESVYLQAIENTNAMADSVEYFSLDTSFKYPKLYDNEEEVFKKLVNEKYRYKVNNGIISKDKVYKTNILEEFRVFKKIGMIGFMLFMSEMATWCRENNIPFGFCRGSVGGSTIAYILDIIDLDPVRWKTVFSRFANEDRIEIGDIDMDFSPSQRELVYNYIINRFGKDYTSYILAIGTISDKGTIDEIGRALASKWIDNHKDNIINELEKELEKLKSKKNKKANDLYGEWEIGNAISRRINELINAKENPYSLKNIALIKQEYERNPEETKEKYPDIFYYFDGLVNTAISQSMHPAGMIASPVSLPDNYGTIWREGKRITCINMEEVHEVSLVKYDILGLKNIEIIKDTCEIIGIPYPLSHEINWEDEKAWEDIINSPVGIFQFEGNYAYDLMKRYIPHKINDLSLVNACLRPSGASYRDRLIAREFNNNPSTLIDDLLKDNNGFLVFQEDVIAFLQQICGLSGSEADNVRRAIGRKQKDRIDKALPQILEGYCSKSDKPRNESEKEAKEFLDIIEAASSYMFGYNHSTGYSMIGYLCGYFRYYYPGEFITAYLNNANNEDDIRNGTELAKLKGISIESIQFGKSLSNYTYDKETNTIYKGIASIKFCNSEIGKKLYDLKNNHYNSFVELLPDVMSTGINSRQLDILSKLNFFKKFGKSAKILRYIELYNVIYGAKQLSKDKANKFNINSNILIKYSRETEKKYILQDVNKILEELWSEIPDKSIHIKEIIKNEVEFLGYPQTKTSKIPEEYAMVVDINTKYKNPIITLYRINNGETETVKVKKKNYSMNPFDQYDILKTIDYKYENKWKKVEDGFERSKEKEMILSIWQVIKEKEEVNNV